MFELTLVLAKNLENVRSVFRDRVRIYAKVSLGNNPRTEKRSRKDKRGQTNPVWNFKATYIIGKNTVESQDIKLLIRLYCPRTGWDSEIGEASVSLKELFDHFSSLPQGEGSAKVNYPVKSCGNENSQGEVCLRFKFGDVFNFVPPSIDWGKLCLDGTKFLIKGSVLCLRFTLLVKENKFNDVPIDAFEEFAQLASDLLSQIKEIFESRGFFVAVD